MLILVHAIYSIYCLSVTHHEGGCSGSKEAAVPQGESCHRILYLSLDKALSSCLSTTFTLFQVLTIIHCVILFLFFSPLSPSLSPSFCKKTTTRGLNFFLLSHHTHAHTSVSSVPIPMIFKHILVLRNNP